MVGEIIKKVSYTKHIGNISDERHIGIPSELIITRFKHDEYKYHYELNVEVGDEKWWYTFEESKDVFAYASKFII